MSYLDDLIAQAESQNPDLPPGLLGSVIYNGEASGSNAVSPKGAMGRAQLMPDTARELGVTDPHDDRQAIPAAARYLAQNVKRFGVAGGVAAYNAGPGAVEQHGGVPPYPETQAYVRRVTGALDGADIFADDDKAAPKADPADGSDIFADKPPAKAGGGHDAADGADIFTDPAPTAGGPAAGDGTFVYRGTLDPLNEAQTKAFRDLESAKKLDPNAQPGSAALPYALKPGTRAKPGEWFVDYDGTVKQEPVKAEDVAIATVKAPLTWAKNYAEDYGSRAQSAYDSLKGHLADETKPSTGWDLIPGVRGAKIAMDLGASAWAPFGAAWDAAVGRPVEIMSGGKLPHQQVSDVTSMVVPFVGELNTARETAAAAKAAGMTIHAFEQEQAANRAAQAALAAQRKASAPVQPPGPVQRALDPFAARASDEAVKAQAARVLAGSATDLPAVKSTLKNVEPEIVPGSQPTTFQLTGDMGLGSLERDVQTRNPAEFNERRADQNASRRDLLTSIQSGADPVDVARAFRQHLDDLDASTDADVAAADARGQANVGAVDATTAKALDTATTAAQDAAHGLGGEGTPDAYGEALRGTLDRGETAARTHERALWNAVDPNGDLTGNVAQTVQAAKDIRESLPPTAKPMAGEEAGIFDAAANMPALAPVQDLIALRSRVSTELRNELIANGRSPAYARLSQLRGAIQDNLATTIAHEVARDNAAAARGAMSPADTLAAQLEGFLAEPERQAAAGVGHGEGAFQASARGSSPTARGGGAEGSRLGGPRRATGGSGLSGTPGGPGRVATPEVPSPAELDQARADIETLRKPQTGSLFAAVKKLGGLKAKNPITGERMPGPDVAGVLRDVRHPGLFNNQKGMAPDLMARVLNDAGWFGKEVDDPAAAFEAALDREARGAKVFHPDDASPDVHARVRLQADAMAAGVSANDTPAVAARKLAQYRTMRQAVANAAEGAEGLGIRGAREMQPEELLGDLQERAAIQAESPETRDPAEEEFDRHFNSGRRPTFDNEAAGRLAQATEATRNRAGTYGLSPVKAILARDGTQDRFKMADGQVASKVFHPGPTGFDDVQRALKAAPDARPVLEDYAAFSLKRAAMSDDGVIDPRKFSRWRQQHQDALRALPSDLQARFSNASQAGRAVADAGLARAKALKDAQAQAAAEVAKAAAARKATMNGVSRSPVGRLANLTEGGDVSRTVGSILNGRTADGDMRLLHELAKDDPNAVAGFRQAIADHVARTLIGNTEAATSGVSQIKADAYQTFMRTKRSALEPWFSPQELSKMDAIAADLQRSNRSLAAVKIPGQSNSMQDFFAASRRGMPNKGVRTILDSIAGGLGAVLGHTFGPAGSAVGSAAGFAGAEFIQALRAEGIAKVDDLVTRAMLDPKVAEALLDTLGPKAPKVLVDTKRARLLKALAGTAGAASSKETRRDDLSPAVRKALGR